MFFDELPEITALTCKDVMTAPVIAIAPNALIEEALDLMLEHSISGLPVVDDDMKLVGVISEFDALMLIHETPLEFQLIEPVSNFMQTNVECVTEDTPVLEAANTFRRRPVRRLPVLREGRVVGILSRRNLVRLVRETRCRLALVAWERDLAFDDDGEGGELPHLSCPELQFLSPPDDETTSIAPQSA